jgi:hypothetical protein
MVERTDLLLGRMMVVL